MRKVAGKLPAIAVVTSTEKEASRYVDAMVKRGVAELVLLPFPLSQVSEIIATLDGLLFTGGLDLDPVVYGEQRSPKVDADASSAIDEWQISLLSSALSLDMPVLGICRGMQLINVCFGGKLIQDVEGHRLVNGVQTKESIYHQVYIAPGSKLAAILGSGGFVRVNSMHHQGFMEAQKASRLIASVYSLSDGIIEAVESPYHDCVIGVQWHNEIEEELPKSFGKLFGALIERSKVFSNKKKATMPKL